MQVWAHHRWDFALPERHKFPLSKYRLLAERVVADGTVAAADVLEPEPVSWAQLGSVHEPALLARIRDGGLSVREERGLGLPWSAQLVERGRHSAGGTLAAAHHALAHGLGMNLGGGTHHAGRDFARGYCLFNDVAVAIAELRASGLVRRALVVDCDVHQGDGTAQLLHPDPDAFALSLHGARNYPFQRIPSDSDLELRSGMEDEEYLAALGGALDAVLAGRGADAASPPGTNRAGAEPDLAFYLAGADPWEGDRLGRLSLSKAGLLARDELVLDRLRGLGVPVCVVLAGGYAEDVRDTVDINAATARAVAARLAERTPRSGGRPAEPLDRTPIGE